MRAVGAVVEAISPACAASFMIDTSAGTPSIFGVLHLVFVPPAIGVVRGVVHCGEVTEDRSLDDVV